MEKLGISVEMRRAVFAKCHGFCWYCGTQIDPANTKGWASDHIFPECRGGVNLIENLILACYACNRAKKDSTPQRFLERMQIRHASMDFTFWGMVFQPNHLKVAVAVNLLAIDPTPLFVSNRRLELFYPKYVAGMQEFKKNKDAYKRGIGITTYCRWKRSTRVMIKVSRRFNAYLRISLNKNPIN